MIVKIMLIKTLEIINLLNDFILFFILLLINDKVMFNLNHDRIQGLPYNNRLI